jgi:arginyl-tRNA synthetase
MLDRIRAALAESLRAAARERLGAEVERVVLERPPKLSLGDFACPIAFDLAKALKKPPRAIAGELADAVRLPAGVRQARVEGGGYLNFSLDRDAAVRALLAGPPPAPERRSEKVIVEHTNINPNKAAHIGHLRNAALGDTLARVLRFRDTPVEVQNYIDDLGVQVADIIVGFRDIEGKSLDDIRHVADTTRFDYYCWDLYSRVTEWYEGHPERLAVRTEALHDLEAGHNRTAEIGAFIADRIVRTHL